MLRRVHAYSDSTRKFGVGSGLYDLPTLYTYDFQLRH